MLPRKSIKAGICDKDIEVDVFLIKVHGNIADKMYMF